MIYIIEADEGTYDSYVSYIHDILEGPKGDLDYLELEFQKTRRPRQRNYGPKYIKEFTDWLITAKQFKRLAQGIDWNMTTIRVGE